MHPNVPEAEFQPKSVTFIPASVYDNVDLMRANPEYLANLMALTRVKRLRMLGGNWKVGLGKCIPSGWFKTAQAVPSDIVKQVRSWDLASTLDTGKNDPDWCCSFRVGMRMDKSIWIWDCVRFRGGSLDVENAIENTARRDGVAVEGLLEQEGGLVG